MTTRSVTQRLYKFIGGLSETERTTIDRLLNHLDSQQMIVLRDQLAQCRLLLGWMVDVQHGRRDATEVAVYAKSKELPAEAFDLTVNQTQTLYQRLHAAVTALLGEYLHNEAVTDTADALIRDCARRWGCLPAT